LLKNSTKELAVATVNFSVPEQVKRAFNRAFARQNKSAVIAELMRDAVARQAQLERRRAALRRIAARRRAKRRVSERTVRQAREKGRP
jgi:hypothetical protein